MDDNIKIYYLEKLGIFQNLLSYNVVDKKKVFKSTELAKA